MKASFKISEIKDFVHSCGKWQSENCYTTKCELVKDYMVIANFDTNGDEKDVCRDVICLQNDNGFWHIVDMTIGMVGDDEPEKINCLANMLYAMQFKKEIVNDCVDEKGITKKSIHKEAVKGWEQMRLF